MVVNRALLGIYDPSSAGDQAHARESLVRALGAEDLQVVEEGPFTVAWRATVKPPVAEGGPFCLVDGRLFNLEAIAREARVPPTEAPEAVLTAAYERWGEGMLERLRGDFILVLWDPARGRALLARDQLGGSSLFFHAMDARLVFASELCHILRLLPRRPSPDRISLVHWLLPVSAPPGDRTLYEGIRRLENGHYLRLSAGRWSKQRSWTLRYEPPLRASRTELAEELRAQLAIAVRRRCEEPETTGIVLSGGLDSSTVAGVATQLIEPSRAPMSAYSAVFPDHTVIDEADLIDITTARFGLRSTRIAVHGGSVLASSLDYLRAFELPSISPNFFFWVPLLRRAAADGVNVLLGGDDGDHLFGYRIFLLGDLLRRGRVLRAARLLRRVPLDGIELSPRPFLRALYGSAVRGALPHAAHQARRRQRGPQHYAPKWFTAESARAYFETQDPWSWKLAPGPRWWASLVDVLVTGITPKVMFDLLRQRATMAGVQSRNPLTDVDLIHFALRLPPELAFDPRFDRPLVRESMSGIVPDEVRLRRDKALFDMLFLESISRDDLHAVRRLLSASDARVRAYIRPEVMRRELLDIPPSEYPAGLEWWAPQVWKLVTAECWLRFLEDSSFPEYLLATESLREASYEFETHPAAHGAARRSRHFEEHPVRPG